MEEYAEIQELIEGKDEFEQQFEELIIRSYFSKNISKQPSQLSN